MDLIDGEIKDERHYKGYTIRVCRKGDMVEIMNVYGSGFPYPQKEMEYSEFVNLTEGKRLEDVF